MILRSDTPCKVNLFLKVAGKRQDGWHNIETLFIPLAAPFDSIKLEIYEGNGITAECAHPDVPDNMDNLCAKAAAFVLEEFKISAAIKIHIEKRIPVAAGLGGGSSDCAAVLKMLMQHYSLPENKIREIALKCGSDVPFFLNPVPSIATGRGEILTPLTDIKIPEIKILPFSFPVSAKWAYTNMADCSADCRELSQMTDALKNGDFTAAAKLVRNDLAPELFKKFPLLAIERRRLLENGASAAQISGSGPTIFYF